MRLIYRKNEKLDYVLVEIMTLQILGIRSQSEIPSHRKVLPQFMIELYNIIADSNGVTRELNPYNAKIVRSFIEKGSFSII